MAETFNEILRFGQYSVAFGTDTVSGRQRLTIQIVSTASVQIGLPTIGYPSPLATNPTTIIVGMPVDAVSGDKINIDRSASAAMTSATRLSYTITDTDVTNGTASIGLSGVTLVGITYFQAVISRGGVDSANKSNIVAWGDTTAPVISTSATQSILETQQLAIGLTATDTGGVPAITSDGVIPGWYIDSGVDQTQFEVSGATLRWVNNGSQLTISPVDQDRNNVYSVAVGAVDYGGNKATPVTINTTVNTADLTPDAFAFTDITGATVTTLYTSNSITLSGLQAGFNVPATVTGGQYQKNAGVWTNAGSFTVQNGDIISLRCTTSASTGTQTNVTLTVGSGPGYSDTYTVTTAGVLSDDFNGGVLDTSKWQTAQWRASTANQAGTVAQTSGQLVVSPITNGNGNDYNGIQSIGTMDLSNGSVFVKLANISAAPSGEQAYLAFGPSNATHYAVCVTPALGTLNLDKWIADSNITSNGVTYNATNHAWLRLRFDATHVYMDAAPTTASNPPIAGDWTNLVTLALDVSVPLTAGHIAIGAGCYLNLVGGTIAVAFDGLNGAI